MFQVLLRTLAVPKISPKRQIKPERIAVTKFTLWHFHLGKLCKVLPGNYAVRPGDT